MANFEYYYGADAEQFNFFRIPKKIIQDKHFSKISSDAKILYGILMDRMTLSAKNGWLDDENRIYIIFTVKDVMEEFACSERKAIMLLAELDTKKGVGLIEKKRQGLGKPNIIYVKNFNSLKSEAEEDVTIENECVKANGQNLTYTEEQQAGFDDLTVKKNAVMLEGEVQPSQNCKNLQVKNRKNMQVKNCKNLRVKNCKNVQVNNDTEYNDTENIYNNLSIHLSTGDLSLSPTNDSWWMDREIVQEMFRERLEYNNFVQDYPCDRKYIDSMLALITDACCSNAETQVIGGNNIRTKDIRSRFMQLNAGHIRYVLNALDTNTTKIKNIRTYLLACLYNAPATIGVFYKTEVQHDLYGD